MTIVHRCSGELYRKSDAFLENICYTWRTPDKSTLLTLCFHRNHYDIYYKDELVPDFHDFRNQLSIEFLEVMTCLARDKKIVVEYVSKKWGLPSFGTKFLYVEDENYEYNETLLDTLVLHNNMLPDCFTRNRTLATVDIWAERKCHFKTDTHRALIWRFNKNGEISRKIYEFNSIIYAKPKITESEVLMLREMFTRYIVTAPMVCSRSQFYAAISNYLARYDRVYGFNTHKMYYRQVTKLLILERYYLKRLHFTFKE